MREEKSFSQRAFSIYTDIRKLQDKAKTSYTLSTRRLRFGYEQQFSRSTSGTCFGVVGEEFTAYLNGITGEYAPPAGYLVNEKEAEAFDREFPYMENPIRLYSLDEITEIFCKLGLRICNSFADFSGKPSSDNDIQLMVYSIRE